MNSLPRPQPSLPGLLAEIVAIVLRRPRPSALIAAGYRGGERFPVVGGPVSGVLVPLVIIGLLADLPLSFILVGVFHPSHPALVHICIAALACWSLGWAIAVRSVVRSSPHVVDQDTLWIGGGIRLAGVIPKVAIERVVAFDSARREWMEQHRLKPEDVVRASGIDPPNLAILIKESMTGLVTITGSDRYQASRRWFLLYADNPAALSAALLRH